MKVICSGASKTGTKTLSAALRILGYNVFDFEEQFFYRGRELMKVMDEGWTTEDIYKIFKDVDAVTDIPGCVLWEEILKAFPEAKAAPKEQILYFKFSDGWERLCQFLDKPIPAKPFPHRNKGGEITVEIIDKSYVFNQIRKELAVTFTVIAILLGLLVYYLW